MFKKISLSFIDTTLLSMLTLSLIAPAVFGVPFFILIAIQFCMTFGYFYLIKRSKKQKWITAIAYPIFTVIIALLISNNALIPSEYILTFFITMVGITLWLNTILSIIVAEKIFKNRHKDELKGENIIWENTEQKKV